MNSPIRKIFINKRVVKFGRGVAAHLPRAVEKWVQFKYCQLKYTKQFNQAGYSIRHRRGELGVSGHGMTIAGPNSQTLHIVNEVWFDRVYDFKDFKMAGTPHIVIDIGFNIGVTGILHAQDDDVVEIYAYEPFPTTFEWARRNIESNPIAKSKIKAFNFGLSDHNADEVILPYDSDLMGNQSTIAKRQIENFGYSKQYEPVQLRRASEVLRPIFDACRTAVVIKIDCEGEEHKILPDLAEAGLLGRVSAIIMEYHDYTFLPLIKILEENGFATQRTFNSYKDSTGMIRAYKRPVNQQ
ncbi:MAG: FkbM family methyltransferase [Proteobacteria bacterium]|nr:FkbM family methyltransferase [Pseudomonadota bacterium]